MANFTNARTRYESVNSELKKMKGKFEFGELGLEWKQTLVKMKNLVDDLRRDVIAEERMLITRITVFPTFDNHCINDFYVRGYLELKDLKILSGMTEDVKTNAVSIKEPVIGTGYIDLDRYLKVGIDLGIKIDIIYPYNEEYLDVIRDEHIFFSTPKQVNNNIKGILIDALNE